MGYLILRPHWRDTCSKYSFVIGGGKSVLNITDILQHNLSQQELRYDIMDDHVQVDDDTFALLKSYAGTEITDHRIVQLAGESLEICQFTGQYYINVPSLDKSVLKSWNKADYWLENLSPFLSIDDILPENLSEDFDPCAENATPPIVIFGSMENFKKSALTKLVEKLEDKKSGAASVEVRNGDATLYMVYDDLDDWAFDFSGRIKIFRDDNLTEENGYYEH